uniref:Putative ferrous iron transport protein n=1 Tax=viral metagenome TaxID=1070528 RepID=A0A6M3LVA9_9ZZZZ
MRLDKLLPGQSATVVGYIADSVITRRLAELGLTIGRRIICLREAPLNGPMQIQIGVSSLTIRKKQAALVRVDSVT